MIEWQNKLFGLPGYKALALMDSVKRTAYVFQGNTAEYKQLVADLQDPGMSLPIFDIRNPDAHDRMLSEAERRLHNVLTALSSRVDQQRKFMEQHFAGTEISNDHDARVGVFRKDPGAQFLKGLRNYMTHRSLPVAQSRQNFSNVSYEVTFVLPVEPLLKWGGWNRADRDWIKGHGEAVSIVDVVDQYAKMASDHDRWLHDRIATSFATEISVYKAAAAAFDAEHARIFGL